MSKKRIPNWPSSQTFKALVLGSAVTSLLSSCQEKSDMSYEREVIKLKAERELMSQQLDEKESKLSALQSQISTLRKQASTATSEAEALKAKSSQASSTPKKAIDAREVRLGLMEAVDGLQKDIESKQSNLSVMNYALDQLDINTEFPFAGVVSMNIQNTTSGKTSKLYFQAKGNIHGQWILTNSKKPVSQEDLLALQQKRLAELKKQQEQAAKNAAAKNKPAARPAKPVDPNIHVIDWSKIE